LIFFYVLYVMQESVLQLLVWWSQ